MYDIGPDQAIVLIFKNPLEPSDFDYAPVDSGIVFFDWLQENYPNGFGSPIKLIRNREPIELENMDFVLEPNDSVSIIVSPGGQALAGYLLVAAISAVASIAASLVVSLIFGKPKKPREQPSPDPVYSLEGGANMARLGEPIPVGYGKFITYPDSASMPYSFFQNNIQYIDQILCIGQGEYDIHEILVGETRVSDMAPLTVEWKQWGPNDHLSIMGNIEGETGIRENIVTSIEVSDQTFTGAPTAFFYKSITINSSSQFTFTDTVKPTLAEFPVGTAYRISASPNLGSPVYYGITTSYNPTTGVATTSNPIAQSGSAQMKCRWDKPGSGGMAGYFVTSSPGEYGTQIECDFVFPNGLYHVQDDGDFENTTVSWTITYQQIDDSGGNIGSLQSKVINYTAATSTPQRLTYTIPVTSGRYKVAVQKTSADHPSNRYQEDFSWTGMRFVLNRTATPVYGNTTLLSVRIRATNGLPTDAANKIRVTATRKLPIHGSGALTATRSPVDAFIDICTNTVYGLGRPLDMIDVAGLIALETHWTPTYALFDGIFNVKTTIWEALKIVLQPVAAIPIRTGRTLGAASDGYKIAPVQLFSDANMVEGSFQASYQFDRPGEYAGVQVEYRDPVTFKQSYVQYPASAVDMETVVLFGCTSATIAQQYARLLWQRKLYLRQFATFETEMEGFIPTVSSRVLVSTTAVMWGESGEVIKSLNPNTIMLDRTVDLTQYASPIIVLRDPDGKPSAKINISAGAGPRLITLASPLPFTIYPVLGDKRATEWAIGDNTKRVKDFTIQGVEHIGENTTRVTLVIYDERVYDNAMSFLRVPI